MTLDGKIALEEHLLLPPLAAPGSSGAPMFHAARRLNDRLAEIVSQHPKRFAAFAAVPLQDPPAAC